LTVQKKAESRKRPAGSSERKELDFFGSAMDAVCLIDSAKQILYSNSKGILSNTSGIPEDLSHLIDDFQKSGAEYGDEKFSRTDPEKYFRVKFLKRDDGTLAIIEDVSDDLILESRMFQRSEELSILYELSLLESEKPELNKIVSGVVGKLMELTGLEQAVFLAMHSFSGKKQIHNLGCGEELLGALDRELMEGPDSESWIPPRTTIADNSSSPAPLRRIMLEHRLTGCVIIPVNLRGELIGVVLLISAGERIVRVHDSLRFFDLVARHLGSLLERARLFFELEKSFNEIDRKNRIFSEQLALAQKLQNGILQIQFPRKPQIDFTVKYIPSYHLGGDFYDIFEITETRIGVLIADVCGHGVSSALITTFLKAAVRDMSQNPDNPAAMIRSLNQKLLPILPVEMFVSALFLIIDLDRRRLLLSNGGHPFPLFYEKSTGHASEIDIPGVLLSLSGNSSYITREISYSPGDKLFLFTDGLYEIKNNADTLFGVDRIGSLIEKGGNAPAKQTVEKIITEVYAFADKKQLEDDLNLIAIDFLE